MGAIGQDSRFRGIWDMCAIVLILGSCLLVSYQLAFVHRVTLLGSLVVYAIDLLFLIDILLNFRTTYRRGGEEVRDEGRRSHGILEADEHFGDLSLMLGEKRTAGVRATTYCDVFVLDRKDFNRIKDEYREIREVMKKAAAETSEKMSALVMKGVVL